MGKPILYSWRIRTAITHILGMVTYTYPYTYYALALILVSITECTHWSGGGSIIRVPEKVKSISMAVELYLENAIIIVSPGVYDEDVVIKYARNLKIIANGTILVRSFKIQDSIGIVIDGFEVAPPPSVFSSGISVIASSYVKIANCKIHVRGKKGDVTGHGISLIDDVSDVVIETCTVYSTSWGIDLDGKCRRVLIRNCIISNCTDYGLRFGVTGGKTVDAIIENVSLIGGDFIITQFVERIAIRNCLFSKCRTVIVNGLTDMTVDGCRYVNATLGCVKVRRAIISNCDFNYASLYLHLTRDVWIENCTFRNNFYYGLHVTHEANNIVVYNCTFTGNAIGIYVEEVWKGEPLKILIHKCTIKENNEGIYLTSIASGEIHVYFNAFIDNKEHDIGLGYVALEFKLKLYSGKPFTYTYNGKEFKRYLGNFWSRNKPVIDNDGDGICDNSYHPLKGFEDRYPLAKPLKYYIVERLSPIEVKTSTPPGEYKPPTTTITTTASTTSMLTTTTTAKVGGAFKLEPMHVFVALIAIVVVASITLALKKRK